VSARPPKHQAVHSWLNALSTGFGNAELAADPGGRATRARLWEGDRFCVSKESVELKRLIGKFLVAGLLAGGALFAAASPSSALPRVPCMDQAHYNQQVQWYENSTFNYLSQLMAWQSADHYINPLSGQETWAAHLSGNIVKVYTYGDYVGRLDTAQYDLDFVLARMTDFVDTTTVC
jgi:hypothetical protein